MGLQPVDGPADPGTLETRDGAVVARWYWVFVSGVIEPRASCQRDGKTGAVVVEGGCKCEVMEPVFGRGVSRAS